MLGTVSHSRMADFVVLGAGHSEPCGSFFTKALTKPEVHLERLGIVEHLPGQNVAVDFDHDLIELCRILGKVVDESALERLSWQLDEVDVKRIRWVVVEFCTSRNSGMKIASQAFSDLKVICVTEDENGLLDETVALLRAGIVRFVENHVRVLVWSSTPCTGGGLYQCLNRGKPGYDTRLKRLCKIQRGRTWECWLRPLTLLVSTCNPTWRLNGQKLAGTGVGRTSRSCCLVGRDR